MTPGSIESGFDSVTWAALQGRLCFISHTHPLRCLRATS
jgi:hypothetical protein